MADGVGPRAYYSERHGRRAQPLTAEQARSLFANFVGELEDTGDLQEWFGYECVDDYNRVPGRLGSAVGDRLLLRLRHDNVWPLTPVVIAQWDDDTMFDMIEFLYDHVSRGDRESGRFHDFSDCGWHFNTFTTQPARDEYRRRLNEILARVGDGYELDDVGHVVHLPPTGLEPLLSASLPGLDETNTEHVASAIEKFRSRSSTSTQRRDAVRDLSDVLEAMRADVKEHMLSEDERALFQIANQFWIRHNDSRQRPQYDHEAWWSWLFYLYLDSIALVAHLKASHGVDG